ncbi:MAG TPA: hypothetical protein VGK19_18245 [Capsulimonadaceae bacterium]
MTLTPHNVEQTVADELASTGMSAISQNIIADAFGFDHTEQVTEWARDFAEQHDLTSYYEFDRELVIFRRA